MLALGLVLAAVFARPAHGDAPEALFLDAWGRLPLKVRQVLSDSLTGKPVVSLALDSADVPLPEAKEFCEVPQEKSGLVLARFEPALLGRGGKVVLHAGLPRHYAPDAPVKEPMSCRHGSLHFEALAAVLHELAHAYEREALRRGGAPTFPVPSADERYLRLVDIVPGSLWPTLKNTHPPRSPDPYEMRSGQESFAVNFEHFLLDSTYACRRPSQSAYFAKAFGFDPFPTRTCRVNTQVYATGGGGVLRQDLDPARLYRVDYLLATPGTSFISRWGHSMLRLVMCAPARFDSATRTAIPATPMGPACEDDTYWHVVVSYRADVRGIEPGLLSIVKDRFPSRLFLMTFDEIFREYLHGELRSLAAYPIRLDPQQKRTLLHRILESHWGYEGDYHFLSGNCATETRDLLASVLTAKETSLLPTISPSGVQEDWAQEQWIDTLPKKTFASLLPVLKRIWNDQVIVTGPPLSSDGVAQSALTDYMRDSKAKARWDVLQEKLPCAMDRSLALRDFIVLEAQVLRLQEQRLMDAIFSLGREKAPAIFQQLSGAMLARVDRTKAGAYGIPLQDEIVNDSESTVGNERFRKALEALKKALETELSEPIHEIEATRENLQKAFVLQRKVGKEGR
ncbi:MAG: hypothetical protein RL318_2196 [Fibrobacterota bacterium]|jgi:hypothetical protein